MYLVEIYFSENISKFFISEFSAKVGNQSKWIATLHES